MIEAREINKEFILKMVPEELIFMKYLEFKVIDLKKNYLNPLRYKLTGSKDNLPGCKFVYDSRGMLKFNDYAIRGVKNWSIDCFNVVQILNKCNFYEALYVIYEDFDLKNRNEPYEALIDESEKIYNSFDYKKEFEVFVRDWYNVDLDFWNQFYIDKKDLSFFNVQPVEFLKVDGNLTYSFKLSDPAYVYFLGNRAIKIYFPFRDKNRVRFMMNGYNILEGSSLLPLSGDFVILTKSYKDVICQSKFEIPSVSLPSESVYLNTKQYKILKSRFKNIYSLFDNDTTGIRCAAFHSVYFNIKPLMFNKDVDKKDFSDNLKHYGLNYMNDYIEETKFNLNL